MIMKDKNRKAMFAVMKKNIYTKHKWVETGKYDTVSQAQAEADYLKNQKFIMGKDWTGKTRPSPKTEVRIVKR